LDATTTQQQQPFSSLSPEQQQQQQQQADMNNASLFQATYDFRGETEMDLSFRKDDVIKLLDKPYPDWWLGEVDGRRGLFPNNFVKPLTPKQSKHLS
jgi:hypothetical protein